MLRTLTAIGLLTITSAALAQEAVPAAPPPAAPAPAPLTPLGMSADESALKAHIMFLASDALRGREAGSVEYEVAAEYVAAQLFAHGVLPAGDDGSYLQKVPLVSFKAAGQGSFILRRADAETPLVFGEDYVPSPNPSQPATEISGEVVFVGFGVRAPQFGRDDYKGVDVTGKIVAFFGGAPASIPGEERAHFGNGSNKARQAQELGAIGYIALESPTQARVRPFARLAASYDNAAMTWARPDGTGNIAAPRTPALGTLSMKGAEKLFGASEWGRVLRTAESEKAAFRAKVLPVMLAVSTKTEIKPAASSNVVGIIPGNDPAVGSEVVVLSAHLDHVGVGRAVDGDTIYNGAMDNAVGIAALIEEARRFKAAGTAPKRSIMFLAVTAEEKGLVGSDYFAQHPTVAKERLVANVNLDMPIITYKFEDVIAFGANRSTIGPIVRTAAAALGVGFSPDPDPGQGLFTRSDHYRFVQQGIPSVFLWPGPGGPGAAATADFFAKHYHQPSDEVTLPIDWASGVRFVEANYAIARDIANADARPSWNKGDFFGTLYGGYGAK